MQEIELGPASESDGVNMLQTPPMRATATIRSGVFNLTNTILGAGMLGIPAAFAACGMAAGLLLLLLFALLSALGLWLLSLACDLAGRPASFHSVAERALPGSGLLVDAAIAIKCFGVATSYLIVVGDSVPKALRPLGLSGALLDRRVWTVAAAVAVSPLAYLRQIDALRHTSLVALGCIMLITILIVGFAIWPPEPLGAEQCQREPDVGAASVAHGSVPCAAPVVAFTSGMETLRALPVFTFAFTCHQNIVAISNELDRGPSGQRVAVVIGTSEALALTQYVAVAVAGYSTFGGAVGHDVLTTYPSDGPSAGLLAGARLMIAVVVAFSYPLQSHPSRACILSIVEQLLRRRHAVSATGQAADGSGSAATPQLGQPPNARSRQLHTICTTAFLVCSTAVATTVDDLGLVLSLVGATGSVMVSYLLPGLCYYRLCPAGANQPLRCAALGLLIFSLLLMPVSLGLVVSKSLAH